MYKILNENGDTIGESSTIVYIFLGENGAYQECESRFADGFCSKIPKETYEGTVLVDTVFQFPGRTLRGTEPMAEVQAVIDNG